MDIKNEDQNTKEVEVTIHPKRVGIAVLAIVGLLGYTIGRKSGVKTEGMIRQFDASGRLVERTYFVTRK